jgi:hypothetical protein
VGATFVAASAVTSGASLTALTLPSGTASEDRVFLCGESTTQPPTPTGWSVAGVQQLGGGTYGAATGPRWVFAFYRDYDGAWTMPTVTLTGDANAAIAAASLSLRPGAGETFDTPAITWGSDTSLGTAFSVAGGTVTARTGSLLMAVAGWPSNPGAVSSVTLAGSGVTLGTQTTAAAVGGTTTGHDAYTATYVRPVTTTGTATVSLTATLGTGRMGGAIFLTQSATGSAPVVAGTSTATGSGTTITGTKPAGTVAGDVLLATLAAYWQGSPVLTAPDGWALAASAEASGGNGPLRVWRADGAVASTTFGMGVADAVGALHLTRVTGGSLSSVSGAGAGAGTETTVPSLTPPSAPGMLLALSAQNSSTVPTAPAGMQSQGSVANSFYIAVGAASEYRSTTDPTVARTTTLNSSHGRTAAVFIPVAGAPPPGPRAGAPVAPSPTLTGSGELSLTGAGALVAPSPTLAGSGGPTPVTGAGALVADSPTLTGSGALSLTGSSALAAGSPTLTGSGGLSLAGAGALAAPSPTLTGSGGLSLTGAGALVAPSPTLAGSGGPTPVTGAGALVAASPTLTGSGALRVTGVSALVAGSPTLTGSGALLATAGGALVAQPGAIDGLGELRTVGAGALVAGPATLAAAGLIVDPSSFRDLTVSIGAPSVRGLTVGAVRVRDLTVGAVRVRTLSVRLET